MILKIRPTNTIITSQTLNTYRRKKTFGIFFKNHNLVVHVQITKSIL